MNPDELKSQMQEMLDAAMESAMEKIPSMIKDMVMAEMAAGGEEVAAKEDKMMDEAPSINPEDTSAPEEEMALDESPVPSEEDPIGGVDEELTLDGDAPIEDRVDSRVLDIVVQYERVTGKRADFSKSPKALAAEAAAHVGLNVRADSSCERLLGALEGYQKPEAKSAWATEQVKVDAAKPEEFVSASEYNRRRIAAMGGSK